MQLLDIARERTKKIYFLNKRQHFHCIVNCFFFSCFASIVCVKSNICQFHLSILYRIVLVPHLGSATMRTESDMASLAATNVIRALDGLEMLAPVYILDAK